MSGPDPTHRIVLLGNPASGRGYGARALEAARAALQEQGAAACVYPTAAPGHAVELARAAAVEGAALLLVVGGDGTVRDAVEGILRAAAAPTGINAPPIAIVPGGTGNDLARTLGLPRDPRASVRAALSGQDRRLDVWRWNEAPFVNVAGVGLDAAVAGLVNRKFRRMGGTLAYLAAFCLILPGFQPVDLELAWPEGGWAGSAWLAAFANACCYGGGMRIAPHARPDDGMLDVIVVEAVPRLELLRAFPGIFTGTHIQHPRVHSFRVETVGVTAPPQPATLDGELIASAPATITRAGAVRIRVPSAGGT